MTPLRVAFFVSVIGTALAVSYFFILAPENSGFAAVKSQEDASLLNSLKDSTKLVVKNALDIISPEGNSGNSLGSLSEATTNNLTDYFVKIITEQIKEKNSSGLTKKEDGSLAILAPSDESIEKQLGELFAGELPPVSGSEPLYHPRVNETKLQITSDTSNAAQLQYVKNFVKLTRELSQKYPLDINAIIKEIEEKEDGTSARRVATIQEEMATRYAQLSVPKNWADFQKAVLSHYFAAHDVWQNISNFKNDPLQALLSLQELELIQQSELGIIVLLEQEVSKYGLNYNPANE